MRRRPLAPTHDQHTTMFLQRLYDQDLAQASFLLGCQATGEALVIDPNRDIARYLAAADEAGLRIAFVTETHIHADFVSGSRALVARTGAQLLLSGEGGTDWQYAFAAGDGARLLQDGDTFMVGNLKVDVLHTPGHTPEHLSYLVTDTRAADRPFGMFTGDFIFAGDVGRPDLLERAAHVAGSMEPSARSLFRSIQRTRALPDYLQLFPGHGAGSACGKALGAVPSTTLGYERIANWAFNVTSEDAFVHDVLAGQPEAPSYFAEMKRINRAGPPVLDPPLPGLRPNDAARLAQIVEAGATLVDVRSAESFAESHVAGALNIPLGASFSRWVGSLVGYERDFWILAHDDRAAAHAMRLLANIGLDRCQGYFGATALHEYASAGGRMTSTQSMSVSEVDAAMRETSVRVIDVRDAAEWEAGHLPGVENFPLAQMSEGAMPPLDDGPLVVHCQSGARAAIAVSVLAARGFRDVRTFTGGFAAWKAAGLAIDAERTGASHG